MPKAKMIVESPRRRKFRVTLVLGGALALLGIGTGIGYAESGGSDIGKVSFAPSIGPIPILSSDPAHDVQIMAKSLPLVASVSVEQSSMRGERRGLIVKLSLKVPGISGPMDGFWLTKANWEGQLLAGAIRDRYAASHLGDIVGTEASYVTPSGERAGAPSGLGNVIENQRFDIVPGALANQVAENAPSLGLTQTRTSVIPVIDDAIDITAVAADPAQTAHSLSDDVIAKLLGRNALSFEGVLVEVYDSKGTPVIARGFAPRAGSGLLWVRPGMQVRSIGDPIPYTPVTK